MMIARQIGGRSRRCSHLSSIAAPTAWGSGKSRGWPSANQHDRIGMAASIDMRVPFLDNQIFDFAFHLPRRATLHRRIGKWLVKEAVAEILPADIVYKKKKGFPMPNGFSQGTQYLLVGGMPAELLKWPANTTQEIVHCLAKKGDHVFILSGLWLRIFFGREAPAGLGERLNALVRDYFAYHD